ncbi:MAG TPA: hemerythrin domain-containing protein [Burkholderiales bacterium]|nr:hemerythrin domain-containing protein [Burkholderiales bacterium]
MKRRKQPARNGSDNDAIRLLTEDHKMVKKLFKNFESLRDGEGAAEEKSAVVRQICNELTIHAKVEEEIFYPVVRESIGEEDLMDEADVEHAGATVLIAQLERMKPEDDHYDAMVTVLGEYIDHHVKEEQEEMFPKAKKAKVDMVELGARITERKAALRGERSAAAESDR